MVLGAKKKDCAAPVKEEKKYFLGKKNLTPTRGGVDLDLIGKEENDLLSPHPIHEVCVGAQLEKKTHYM